MAQSVNFVKSKVSQTTDCITIIMPAAPGAFYRCVPVSFNISLLQLRLPAFSQRKPLCAGRRNSLGSSGLTGKPLTGVPNRAVLHVPALSHPSCGNFIYCICVKSDG